MPDYQADSTDVIATLQPLYGCEPIVVWSTCSKSYVVIFPSRQKARVALTMGITHSPRLPAKIDVVECDNASKVETLARHLFASTTGAPKSTPRVADFTARILVALTEAAATVWGDSAAPKPGT